MKSIWLKSNATLCVLTGNTDVATGYDNIIDSWANSFFAPKQTLILKDQKLNFMVIMH